MPDDVVIRTVSFPVPFEIQWAHARLVADYDIAAGMSVTGFELDTLERFAHQAAERYTHLALYGNMEGDTGLMPAIIEVENPLTP